MVFLGDRIADAFQLDAVELDQSIALLAVEVVVAGVAVVVFIDASGTQGHPPQQPGIDQFIERAIDRRPADLSGRQQRAEVIEQFLNVEMVVVAEHLVDDQLPLRGQSFAGGIEKFGEPQRRRCRYCHRPKLESPGHGRLPDLIEEPREGNLELLGGFVGAASDFGTDGRHAIEANSAGALRFGRQLRFGSGRDLQFVLNRSRRRPLRRLNAARDVRCGNPLRTMKMSWTVNVHPNLHKDEADCLHQIYVALWGNAKRLSTMLRAGTSVWHSFHRLPCRCGITTGKTVSGGDEPRLPVG